MVPTIKDGWIVGQKYRWVLLLTGHDPVIQCPYIDSPPPHHVNFSLTHVVDSLVAYHMACVAYRRPVIMFRLKP